ncbi:hypothetical protein SAMN04488057_11714 [Cyclobacterium lianum]|uniref:Uncharacterized protein n=1 Tax=Cyclobacterium lianum TaxID=388280 RepID=A0A1M7QE77_9BACT|nr:hypothetical protein [Cyclobacterium lianum]SHN29223.1 hypothetical protein SAMN04488057_11714 [Cyclobacterium lianum]
MLKSNKKGEIVRYIFIFSLILNQSCNTDSVSYPSFQGSQLDLSFQKSDQILLLFPVGNYNTDTLAALLSTYDQAYELATELSGREPDPSHLDGDRLPLALVPSTCGSGCGRLGRKGIEITEEKFRRIYDQFVKEDKYDHLFFYELGRNFWFYEPCDFKLQEMDDIRTGFAVFFRDILVSELKMKVAPINGKPYLEYMQEKNERWNKMKKEWSQSNDPDEFENLRGKYFPNGPLFWSTLWWERYQMYGKESIQKTLQDLQQDAPRSESEWLEFFTENSRKKAAR